VPRVGCRAPFHRAEPGPTTWPPSPSPGEEDAQDFTNNSRLLLRAIDKFNGRKLQSSTVNRLQNIRTDPATGVRRLDKIDLWEISIVTFPMLPEARVSTVKRRQRTLGAIRYCELAAPCAAARCVMRQ
jgi:hypothetical protein